MSNRRPTTIAIISSSDLIPTADVQSKVVAALTFIPDGSEVRVRKRTTSQLEGWIFRVREQMDIRDTSWLCSEWVTRKGGSNYKRDREMMEGVEHVIAFFTRDKFMDGGTGHAVQCAIEADIPVETWVLEDDGLKLVAEYDGDGGLQASPSWTSSRNVAEMVLKFNDLAKTSLVSWRRSPKRSSRPTSTGSGSMRSTGRGRSHTGSIFQARSD
jgi:hypothetical protein